MPKYTFKYKQKASGILGKINRPLIDIEAYSEVERDWIFIPEVLADTGADISILPRKIGEILIKDITSGKYLEIRGIAPSSYVVVFLHNLKIKIGNEKIYTRVAIADSDDVPPILGRVKGLDLFFTSFIKGRIISLEK